MSRLRISGIVGIANHIRQALAAPLSAEHRATLAGRVERSLAEINAILTSNGARASDLPAPSRKAYEFLTGLDVRNLPLTTSETTSDNGHALTGASVRFPGLRTYLTRILDDAALGMVQGRFNSQATLQVIRNTTDRLNHIVARDKIAPAHLRPEPRQLLGWFRHFSNAPAFERYVAAVRLAQRVLPAPLAAHSRWRQPFLVHFRPSGMMYRIQVLSNATRMIFDTPMISFDEPTMRQLAQRMLGRRRSQEAMMLAMTSAPYQALLAELGAAAGVVEQTRGVAHDLAEVFDRVNREYFEGQMPRPGLVWSQALTGRKFGHYDFVHDRVCVSRTLDSPEVPAFVVEHVMHHELLHKKHGLRFQNERQHAHTPAFRQEERAFRQYVEADAYLKQLSAGWTT